MTLKYQLENGNLLEFDITTNSFGYFQWDSVTTFCLHSGGSIKTEDEAIAVLKSTVEFLNMKGKWKEDK